MTAHQASEHPKTQGVMLHGINKMSLASSYAKVSILGSLMTMLII